VTGQDRPQASWLRYWSAPVLAPTALATGLALYDLTSRSIWLDESSTFAIANQHGVALWHLLVSAGGNFFLYYPLMHLLVSVFGSSLLVLRLPSALAAIATVPVAAVLLTRLFDRRAAICGTWFLVLSGPLVFWSQQARGYSFAVLFVTTAALGLVTALGGRRGGWWVFAGCSVLAIYTMLLSGLVVVALAVSVGLRGRRTVAWRRWTASLVAIAVGCVPLYLLAVHRGLVVVDWLGRPGTPYGPSNSYLLKFLLSAKTSGMPVTFASPVVFALMLAALALAVGRLGWQLRRHGRDSTAWTDGLLVLWVALPPVAAYAFSAVVQPILEDRYVLTSVPAASMLAGVVVSRLQPRLLSGALAAVLVLALGYQLRPSYGVSLENWRDAEAYVSTHAAPRDCVAFFVADGYDAVDYYVETGSGKPYPTPVLPAEPYSSRTSYALDPTIFTPTELQHAAAACPRLWLVRSHAATNRPIAGSPAYQQLTFTRYRALESQINTYFQPELRKHFTAVTVVCYRLSGGTALASGRAPS
jgi:mannosyltransferase